MCVISHAAWQHANPFPILFLRLRHLVHFDQPCALFPDMLIKKVHSAACEHMSPCERVRERDVYFSFSFSRFLRHLCIIQYSVAVFVKNMMS